MIKRDLPGHWHGAGRAVRGLGSLRRAGPYRDHGPSSSDGPIESSLRPQPPHAAAVTHRHRLPAGPPGAGSGWHRHCRRGHGSSHCAAPYCGTISDRNPLLSLSLVGSGLRKPGPRVCPGELQGPISPGLLY
eukprot:145687-Hanusia_phi.AAC.1